MERKEQIQAALEMLRYSYTPYSNFKVGAALLTEEGELYTGCNIENAAFGPTICAERTAFFKAVSEGKRRFTSIVIVGGKADDSEPYGAKLAGVCPPCGVCRQVMREFCDPETFQIILAVSPEQYEEHTLEELLPMSFGPSALEQG